MVIPPNVGIVAPGPRSYAATSEFSSCTISLRSDSGSMTTACCPKLMTQRLISSVSDNRNSATTPPSFCCVSFWLSDFGVRFVALDFNHISDMGTTWQTCHPFDKASAQSQWYEKRMGGPLPPFVVTFYNEKHSSNRESGKEADQP